ncbi:MAG: hypothetical protein KAH44_08755, partial [Oricola sp.]|nr:hypothetical protein [Oricola sp.]
MSSFPTPVILPDEAVAEMRFQVNRPWITSISPEIRQFSRRGRQEPRTGGLRRDQSVIRRDPESVKALAQKAAQGAILQRPNTGDAMKDG